MPYPTLKSLTCTHLLIFVFIAFIFNSCDDQVDPAATKGIRATRLRVFNFQISGEEDIRRITEATKFHINGELKGEDPDFELHPRILIDDAVLPVREYDNMEIYINHFHLVEQAISPERLQEFLRNISAGTTIDRIDFLIEIGGDNEVHYRAHCYANDNERVNENEYTLRTNPSPPEH